MEFMILNRQQVEIIAPEHDYILIGATEPHSQAPKIKETKHTVASLRLYYSDIDKEDAHLYPTSYLFNDQHADIILSFLHRNIDKCSIIVSQCDGGISRSSATAAALSVIINGPRSDNWIFDAAQYNPNMHVYRTVLNRWQEYYYDKFS